MDVHQFHWPDVQFLNTGTPYEQASDFQMPTHDYNAIGPWDHQGNVTEMQPGEMGWSLYDSPGQAPSNLSPFPNGPPATTAHHQSSTIHGDSGYMNHQPADVIDGVPTPPSYGPTDAMNAYLSEPPTIQSTAYEQAALASQAEATGGPGERDVSSGESSEASLPGLEIPWSPRPVADISHVGLGCTNIKE
ncbi:hypothetical protein F5X99DRAFT_384640 [Biscogniauxia marginata]|nr:hypothetical protein F5X99DRAFT_384640 [Biscogniauxia marginata]